MIYLDLDGVLNEWVRGVCKLFDLKVETVYADLAEGDRIEWCAGLSVSDFWDRITDAGADFWSDLELSDVALDLYEAARRVTSRVYILTSPSWDPQCAAGKVVWMQRHFRGRGGHPFLDYVLTSHKSLLAGPGTLLIDDRPTFCSAFTEAGGEAWWFPSEWDPQAGMLARQMIDRLNEMAVDRPT